MISEELCCYWLTEASCLGLGFGFEGLDFFTDALVSLAASPFGFGRDWFVDVWKAAKFEAELARGELFAANLIGFRANQQNNST